MPPIDLSLIVFEDEEDEDDCSSSPSPTSSAPSPIPPTHESSPISSSSPIPSATCVHSTKPTKICTVLQTTDRSTDFFWPEGVRPLELQAPFYLTKQTLGRNKNGIDEILNGPSGERAPSSRSPNTSPKWNWEPKFFSMRHVCTMDNGLESGDCRADILCPIEVQSLENPRLGPLPLAPPSLKKV